MHDASARARRASAPSLPRPRDWRRIGLWLVAATMAYNVFEGVIALWAGHRGSQYCAGGLWP